MADKVVRTLNNKRVVVETDGEIIVNGTTTKIKRWSSDSRRYSNLDGRELTEYRGMNLEEMLVEAGRIWQYQLPPPASSTQLLVFSWLI